MLIVLEGLDGAGKSTQVKKLKEYIVSKGRELKYLHFPRFDAPVVGEMIAKFLRGDFGDINQVDPMLVALLYAEDRREASKMVREWLSAGDVVLFDRYVYSNIAFQCAKMEDPAKREELRDWIFKSEYEDFGIPRPDINIFLDVPIGFVSSKLSEVREGDDREYLKGKSDIHEADINFQVKVRNVYLSQCEKDESFKRIDCSDADGNMLPADSIFDKIKSELDKVL
jgi:dTMP kinase